MMSFGTVAAAKCPRKSKLPTLRGKKRKMARSKNKRMIRTPMRKKKSRPR